MYQYNTMSPTLRKVAVYARVSTEHEAQLNALENQIDWYKPIPWPRTASWASSRTRKTPP